MAITIEIFLKFGIKGSQCEVNKLFRILHFQIDIYLHQLKMIQSSIYLYLNDSPSLQIQTNQKKSAISINNLCECFQFFDFILLNIYIDKDVDSDAIRVILWSNCHKCCICKY